MPMLLERAVHRCDSSVVLCSSDGIQLILDVRYCTSYNMPVNDCDIMITRAEQYYKNLNICPMDCGCYRYMRALTIN